MLITRIELENIKSYRHASIDLRKGTTAISGANGAGKTTLVEAIGFALFDYLPYNRDQFVREGEKAGRVTIHLLGGDERPYIVERRCGSSSRWMINDTEADMRLEQKADVLDKLHDLFGIDRERPLDSLFRDALGVPQGTFTAIFLDAASKRKQTFDALLQIEDYKHAADNLLETTHYYRDQLREQQTIIDRLEFETRDLADWQKQLVEARQLDAVQKQRNSQLSEQLTIHEKQKQQLDEQQAQLNNLASQLREAQARLGFALATLRDRRNATESARKAQQIVQENSEARERYQQGNERLRTLRQEEKEREALRQQLAIYTNTRVSLTTQLSSIHSQLDEIAEARRHVVELAPLVNQQCELEQQQNELRQQVKRHQELSEQIQKLTLQQKDLAQQLTTCQQQIDTVEPLLPLAQQLDERSEHLNQLKLQLHQRDEKRQQQHEKSQQLKGYQEESTTLKASLARAERNLEQIEESRDRVKKMPELEQERDRLIAQTNRLTGNIEGYQRSREQSAGGQCPLLHESCLNIQRVGSVSLETYFENLLTNDKKQLAQASQKLQHVEQQLQKLKPYAEALIKEHLYVEKRDNLAQQMQRNTDICDKLRDDLQHLKQELSQLVQIEQRIQESTHAWQESRRADQKVRELGALQSRREQIQNSSVQLKNEIEQRQSEVQQYQDSETRLKQIEQQLAGLNDPRGHSHSYLGIINREEDLLQQQRDEEIRLHDTEEQMARLNTELQRYDDLDRTIAEQEQIMQQSRAGYELYQRYINEASVLEERQLASQQQQKIADTAEAHYKRTKSEYEKADSAFNPQDLQELAQRIEVLKNEQSALIQSMRYQQEQIEQLEHRIEEAEGLRNELGAAQQEYQTLDDLHKMLEQFRRHIKDAAPHVLHAMLTDISGEANRIFGEIMGDRSAQLSWQNDYEITLRRQGVERSFAQLSGGEQMSAALAVRLALLKKLSTLNVAFFDEPTQNMDELRRMNLAEQIRRVRGFDQLLVISHDDTFEQGLDSLIRLNKGNGETQIVEDEDGSRPTTAMENIWQSPLEQASSPIEQISTSSY